MPVLFSKLKSQIESNRSSVSSRKIKLSDRDITKDKILRPELIDPAIYDIYKSIPLDPQAFYEDMGCPILHPNTGQQIRQLADYQIEFWKSTLPSPFGLNYNYACCIKSNKIGLTTSELYGDFQSLVKIAPGRQVLVVAQTQEMANDHLYTLKRDILSSEKYSKFLITKSVDGLSKEEQSKVKTLFIRNPLNRFKPGRIIALGPQESSSVSWKEVYRIHVSDITKSRTDYDRTIAGLFSRLANTRGVLKIECVPGMPQGFIFDTAQKPPSNFFFRYYNYEYGVRSGIMSLDFIQEQKESLKNLFDNIYDCKFGSSAIGNVFLNEAIDWSLVDRKEIEINPYTIKSMGIDPGFGSSAFGICVTQFNNGKVEVIYADEFNRSSYEEMINLFWEIKEKVGSLANIYVDASFPAIIKTLKKEVGEADDWEYVKRTIEYCKKNRMDVEDAMVVVPVAFGNNGGVELLQNAKMILEDNSKLVKMSRDNEKLIVALRTAWADGFRLDKNQTSYDDLFDAFRLSLWKYKFKK